jgi:hypothetical protein
MSEPMKPPGEEGGVPGPFVERATKGDLNRPGVLEAELDRYTAGTERERAETAIRQQEAGHQISQEQRQGEVDNRIKEKEADAEIEDMRKRRAAEQEDQARRTGAEMSGLESRDRTTEFERYFFMGVVAVGLLATIVLAFMTVGEPLEYRLSPLVGVGISGVGGLRLRAINRMLQQPPPEKDEEKDEEKGPEQERKEDQ